MRFLLLARRNLHAIPQPCDRIYLTRIHKDFEGDTQYPVINPKQFKEVECRREPLPCPLAFDL